MIFRINIGVIHLVPRLRMSGAVPLLPPNAFMVWRGTTLPICSGLCKGSVVCRGEARIQFLVIIQTSFTLFSKS